MARPVSIIELTTQESQELHRRVQASTTTRRDHLRARIILLRAREMRQQDVAEALGVSIVCVNKWSQRFEREGVEGLRDKRGRGRRGKPAHQVRRYPNPVMLLQVTPDLPHRHATCVPR